MGYSANSRRVERGARPHYIYSVDPEISQKLAELRRLERQAKQLIYKMGRIESAWNNIKKDLKSKGKDISHQLGDVLQRAKS